MIAKTSCSHCGGGIEYDSQHNGSDVECPHCGKTTTLIAEASLHRGFAPINPEFNRVKIIKDTEFAGLGCFVQGVGILFLLVAFLFPFSAIIGIGSF